MAPTLNAAVEAPVEDGEDEPLEIVCLRAAASGVADDDSD